MKVMMADMAACCRAAVGVSIFFLVVACRNGMSQTSTPKLREFPLWKFDEMTTYPTCRAKGRLQDKENCESKLVDQIIAEGKASIPILISQLTDSRRTREPIYDYWSYTTAGDIAYFILHSLFTDSDWKTFNMPGLEALNDHCSDAAETCWRRFLKTHGRKFVQAKWLATRAANKSRVYWDESARCYRLSKSIAR
jgi:hypothetical protein